MARERKAAYRRDLREQTEEYASYGIFSDWDSPAIDDWISDYIRRGVKDMPEWGKCPHSFDHL